MRVVVEHDERACRQDGQPAILASRRVESGRMAGQSSPLGPG
jgi:hypothetical protein